MRSESRARTLPDFEQRQLCLTTERLAIKDIGEELSAVHQYENTIDGRRRLPTTAMITSVVIRS
jgi:hypothetical protein